MAVDSMATKVRCEVQNLQGYPCKTCKGILVRKPLVIDKAPLANFASNIKNCVASP